MAKQVQVPILLTQGCDVVTFKVGEQRKEGVAMRQEKIWDRDLTGLNLTLPGNPRYQPDLLKRTCGYDVLMEPVGEVELALLNTLIERGMIPPQAATQLTPEVRLALLTIPTTEVDRVERQVTNHDVRAWIRLAQERCAELGAVELGHYIHLTLTSYDVLDTANTLRFIDSHEHVVRPLLKTALTQLAARVRELASTVQIGRTHGQHALPITAGFWLATTMSRLINQAYELDRAIGLLVGKISGAVGCYNAAHALGLTERVGAQSQTFEEQLLGRLGIRAAPISTQILPPEPLANYLFQCVLMVGAIAQLGRDCRHLMRNEIGEVSQPRATDEVGSSTMAHKRNPIRYENLEGTFIRIKNELGKVMDTLVSEHQRDLVNSSVMRDFPIIIIDLVLALETLTKISRKTGHSLLTGTEIHAETCRYNAERTAGETVGEPLYLALQFGGYAGDAHALVNERLMPLVKQGAVPTLGAALQQLLATDDPANSNLAEAVAAFPPGLLAAIDNPLEHYTGLASQKALEAVKRAEVWLNTEKAT